MEAENLSSDIPEPSKEGSYAHRWLEICATSERMALAHAAVAAIKMAEVSMIPPLPY